MSTSTLKSFLALLFVICAITFSQSAEGQQQGEPAAPTVLEEISADMMLRYFRSGAEKISNKHHGSTTLVQWKERRQELRDKIWQSLGNFPLENRSAVRARVTGSLDHGDHTVEKIVYESLPGLFVTVLVYVPWSSCSAILDTATSRWQ